MRAAAPAAPTFWTALFSWKTWTEFLEAGAATAGYREKKWKTVQRIAKGDILLCYLTGASRWIGILCVVGEPYFSEEPIWADDAFPCRVPVDLKVGLEAETAVPVLELREELLLFRNLKNPRGWGWHFFSAPRRIDPTDAERICEAIRGAAADPVVRPVSPNKLHRRPNL